MPPKQRIKMAARKRTKAPPQPPPPSPPSSRPSSHHIRPPPISYGNPSIHILLRDDDARTRYQNFRDKSFVPIYRLTRSFLDSLHIHKFHELLSIQPMHSFILDNTDCIFPGMVGQFFANLRFESPSARNVLISQVNRVQIRFDWHLLNTIYGTTLPDQTTTLHYWDDTHLWPETSDFFKIAELRKMFSVQSREAKHFNPTNLDPVDRVIYHILVNFINPVAGHFTSPGKVPLVYYYLFTHHTPIDWGFVVFNRLADTVTDHRRNLPHAPFLTPIFKHFQIPFNEPGISPPAFDLGAITKKGLRFHEGTWITRQDYLSRVQPSSSSHPESHNPPSSPPPSSSLDARIASLQQSVHSLLKHVRYLEHGVHLALPEPLQEEFKSDRIFFDLSSDDDGAGPSAADDGFDDAAPADDASSDDTPTDSSDDDGSNDGSDDDGSDPDPEGDVPLIRHFKKSKP